MGGEPTFVSADDRESAHWHHAALGPGKRELAETLLRELARRFAGDAGPLLHLGLDLPLHHNDGRAHFQPFTDWVFESPLSYWDPAHYGWLVGPVEAAVCAALAWALWRRFRSRVAHALIAVALVAELVPALAFPLLL